MVTRAPPQAKLTCPPLATKPANWVSLAQLFTTPAASTGRGPATPSSANSNMAGAAESGSASQRRADKTRRKFGILNPISG